MSDRARIRLFHPYLADLRRPGARKPERVVVKAPIDLDVRTATETDLVVAARFRRGDVYSAWKQELESGKSYELHGFDGGLWQPMADIGGGPLTVDGWRQAILERRELPEPDPILMTQWRREAGYADSWTKLADPGDPDGIFTADDKARGAELAARAAEDILLVDGTIWRRAPTPFWAVERQSDLYTVHLHYREYLEEWNARHPGGPIRIGSFGLERLGEAIAFAERYASAHHRKIDVRGPAGALVRLDPRYYSFDAPRTNAVDLGGLALEALTYMVASMSPQGIEAYADARIAHERLSEGDGGHETIIDLNEAVAKVVVDLHRFTFPIDRITARARVMRENVDPFVARIADLEIPRLSKEPEPPTISAAP